MSCGCNPSLGSQSCSWERFVGSLPAADPVRLRHEAGDDSLSWEHPSWSGEACRCECHDWEDAPAEDSSGE